MHTYIYLAPCKNSSLFLATFAFFNVEKENRPSDQRYSKIQPDVVQGFQCSTEGTASVDEHHAGRATEGLYRLSSNGERHRLVERFTDVLCLLPGATWQLATWQFVCFFGTEHVLLEHAWLLMFHDPGFGETHHDHQTHCPSPPSGKFLQHFIH